MNPCRIHCRGLFFVQDPFGEFFVVADASVPLEDLWNRRSDSQNLGRFEGVLRNQSRHVLAGVGDGAELHDIGIGKKDPSHRLAHCALASSCAVKPLPPGKSVNFIRLCCPGLTWIPSSGWARARTNALSRLNRSVKIPRHGALGVWRV